MRDWLAKNFEIIKAPDGDREVTPPTDDERQAGVGEGLNDATFGELT